jgi:hypothetical protein
MKRTVLKGEDMRLAIGLILVTTIVNTAGIEKVISSELNRIEYRSSGLSVDLGVGLWAWPLPMDYDGDGDMDLVVSCPDVPYNGTYFFENPDGDTKVPTFKPAVRIGIGQSNISPSYVDGETRVLVPGEELTVTPDNFGKRKTIYPDKNIHSSEGRTRAKQWKYTDYDGDGDLDLIVGIGDWADYGWDNAFNEQGKWTRGPLHGYVYLIQNRGTTAQPEYEKPIRILADKKPIDVYGMPSPNFADFDGDGDLDLLCGEFVDGFTYYGNSGSRKDPKYEAGKKLKLGDKPLLMDLCMIVPVAIDWDHDGDIDLIVGQEDGRVAFIEHTGTIDRGMPIFAEPKFFKQQAEAVKFGALVTPVSYDWDSDGDEDIIAGNTAGHIGFIENLDAGNPPKWAPPQRLKAAGKTIQIQAGPNGSIQGPCERKWGYTTLSVADWDHDGMPDIIINSIWGRIIWYRNIGTPTRPELAEAKPIEVEWTDKAEAPEWNWWRPHHKELSTQWRTTPVVVDWDQDGMNDLVMLDHEGYVALFRRETRDGRLVLTPGQRLFRGGTFSRDQESMTDPLGPLRLNANATGKSGRRKLCIVDWDGDGKRDILVNSVNAHFLKNTSSNGPPWTFKDMGPVSKQKLAGHTTSPTTVDWDNDGIRDLLLGAEDGFLYFMKNNTKSNALHSADLFR